MASIFADFDRAELWEASEYASTWYVGAPLMAKAVARVERALGYKMPAAYVEFMQFQNGGIPQRTSHRTKEPTSWAGDQVAVTGIYSVGRENRYSLCGELRSRFWMEEWGYPDIGVYFADCPSAGHDMLCLDYRACGPSGEPSVVHVDQESDYKLTRRATTKPCLLRRALRHSFWA